jgi:hypothetical protein
MLVLVGLTMSVGYFVFTTPLRASAAIVGLLYFSALAVDLGGIGTSLSHNITIRVPAERKAGVDIEGIRSFGRKMVLLALLLLVMALLHIP